MSTHMQDAISLCMDGNVWQHGEKIGSYTVEGMVATLRDMVREPSAPEAQRTEALANAVWNYLGIRTAEEFCEWYVKLRAIGPAGMLP